MTELALRPRFSPLAPQSRTLGWQIGAVLVGSALLAASSHIKVPMFPVPMTMQTFAVTLIGALYGWRLGAVTIMAWLFQGALGLPVLAGSSVGMAYFAGPTAGYLLAFPLAGALTGWLAERGWNGSRMGWAFASMLLGNALCLVVGTAWLSQSIGLDKAIAFGALPFVLGAVVKSALAASTLALWSRGARARG
jgi:biotin transport system substrate-specific component